MDGSLVKHWKFVKRRQMFSFLVLWKLILESENLSIVFLLIARKMVMSKPLVDVEDICLTYRVSTVCYKFSQFNNFFLLLILPYASHYNPRFVYFIPNFLKVKNVFSTSVFQKFLPLSMVSIQERVMMARVRYIKQYTYSVFI